MTVQWSAQKHGLALERVDVRLTQSRTATGRLFRLSVLIGGALSESDRAKLQHAAENCPVARTLTGENALETRVSLDSAARADARPDRQSSASARWTSWMQIDPSPTAEATRLTLVERASPTQNTPGMLVSMQVRPAGQRPVGAGEILRQQIGAGLHELLVVEDAGIPSSQSVLGSAPVIRNRLRMSRVSRSPLSTCRHRTRSRPLSPSSASTCVRVRRTTFGVLSMRWIK